MTTNKIASSLQIAAAVLLAGLAFVVARSQVEPNVLTGDRAPGFRLTSESGRTFAPDDFGGKVLILNFWATWCPPCVDEMPSLNELARQLGPQGVVVLGVNVDRNEAAYRRFLKQAGIGFETVRDPEARVSADYGTFKYPETYVIDAQGRVRQKYIGGRDWTDAGILRDIRALL